LQNVGARRPDETPRAARPRPRRHLLAACDSQGSDDSLIGTWTRLRIGTTEVKDQWGFKADGTMTFDENKPDARAEEDHMTGTYTVSDGVITAIVGNADGTGRERATFTYFANGTVFSPYAVTAPGGHDGIVGVWTGSIKLDDLDNPSTPPNGSSATRDFRSDGTFHWATTPADGSVPVINDGTWVATSSDTFRASVGEASTTIKLVDDTALIPENDVWQRN
jgi:hypothetical protein